MSVSVEKDSKGSTWIISRKKDGFTRQINVSFGEMVSLFIKIRKIIRQKV